MTEDNLIFSQENYLKELFLLDNFGDLKFVCDLYLKGYTSAQAHKEFNSFRNRGLWYHPHWGESKKRFWYYTRDRCYPHLVYLINKLDTHKGVLALTCSLIEQGETNVFEIRDLVIAEAKRQIQERNSKEYDQANF
jgi:hypothetical protein